MPPAARIASDGGALDRQPLLELLAAARRREDREVGRGAVGVDVREAAGDPAALARAPRAWRRRPPRGSGQALPGDRGLERVRRARRGHERVAQVGHAQEGVAPARRRSRRRAARRARRRARGRARAPARARGRRDGRWTQSRARARRGRRRPRRSARLQRVDEPAVGGPQAGLDDRAHGLGAGQRSAAKRTARPARCSGRGCTRTHASVSDPEDALGAEQHPVGRGAGARPRQPARRPRRRRRDRAHGSTRSSMCVGPVAKCPAARVAIQPPSVESSNDCGKKRMRQAVRAEQFLERAGRGARRRCARRARPGRPRARGPARRGRATRRRRSGRDPRLDAADDARAAAVGDRPPRWRRPPTRARPRTSASSRGRSDEVGRRARSARGSRARCRRRTCRRRGRRGRGRRSSRCRQGRRARATRGAGSARVGQRLLDVGRAEAEQLDHAGRRGPRLLGADGRVLEAPAPAVACAAPLARGARYPKLG